MRRLRIDVAIALAVTTVVLLPSSARAERRSLLVCALHTAASTRSSHTLAAIVKRNTGVKLQPNVFTFADN